MKNKVVKTNQVGGLVGLFYNPSDAINDEIAKQKGYKPINISPTNTNSIFMFWLKTAILCITLGLFTIGDSHLILFEKLD